MAIIMAASCEPHPGYHRLILEKRGKNYFILTRFYGSMLDDDAALQRLGGICITSMQQQLGAKFKDTGMLWIWDGCQVNIDAKTKDLGLALEVYEFIYFNWMLPLSGLTTARRALDLSFALGRRDCVTCCDYDGMTLAAAFPLLPAPFGFPIDYVNPRHRQAIATARA